jgi:CheY-like chemotaxis protein
LRRVFRSLLVLAAQSGPKTQLEQSEIRISTRVSVGNDGDEIRVEIGNSRLGRARASDSQVFEPLVSVGSLGATGGLEILISQQTLRRHGGRLVIESGPTAGTIFHVFLPAPSLASQPALAAPGPPPAFVVAARKVAPERRSVLVIDDQLLIRRQIQRALAREHDVILVASAELALIRLELGEVFDVVLCDLEMPEMNGASFHTEIQERWPDLLPRLVFMTGGPMSSASSHFLRTAAIRVLAKPFSLPRLRQFVRDASMRM